MPPYLYLLPGVSPIVKPDANEALSTVRKVPAALTEDECDRVVDWGESLQMEMGGVSLGGAGYRVSRIARLEPGPAGDWLYQRVGQLFAEQAAHYGFEVHGFVEPFQYTVYGPGEHFDWHSDIGPGLTSARKLSMTIQLSGNEEFAGGELEILGGPSVNSMGMATFFPSYMAHRVSPVKGGTRRSLVAWAYGPAFR
jgi:PKHD-type hydroxylase